MSAQPSQFDSHRFIKRLTNAGVSEEVAEILAEEHASRLLPADVATKADISAAEERILSVTSAEIAAAVAGFKDTVADYKTSTLKWMFGMMTAFAGLVITTVTALIVGLG